MSEKNGGAAFPTGPTTWDRIDVPPMPAREGMSLRDYFAGQAMIGMYSCPHYSHEDLLFQDDSVMARAAYATADAMLAERAK